MAFASVVVPASRTQLIDRCLDSLLRTDCGDFEVVVVARQGFSYSRPDRRVHVIEQGGSGMANARNRGIQGSCGKIIAFTDEDCIVSRQWLSSLLRAFDDPETGGAGSIIESYGNRIASLWDAAYIKPGGLVEKYGYLRANDTNLCTTSAAFRAEVIKGMAGFDESLSSGEDYDLSVRVKQAGFKLALVPEARVWHEGPSTLRSVAGQQRRMAQGDLDLAIKYSRKAVRSRLLAAIAYDPVMSLPYGLTHGLPALPAFVFFKSCCRFAGSIL